ncbi:MAG TPA: ATP-binding protein [Vicinamibacterales bacterium]|nr:ATP-binding protein [Vicinamibacterales bacterium]
MEQPAAIPAGIDDKPNMTTKTRTHARRAFRRHDASRTTPRRSGTLAAIRAERDQALERARRTSEFISHASHEIRTPLHGIMGFSTLLLGAELSDEQRRLANSLHASIESLLAVVNDVLDVSTLEAGAMRLESAGFNLVALVRGVADMFSETAMAKGLVLRVDTDGVKHTTVTGDPGRIRQILANFVSNAVKFTDEGSVVIRAATRATSSGTVDVRLAVSDTGPGVPRHAQARLFQPFSRIDRPAVASKPGTGLGLSISKQLVELMGGTVSVSSRSPRGSIFAFTVSLKEDTRPIGHRALELIETAKLRVYVADDDSRSLSELLLSLAVTGVEVAASGSAAGLPEALRTARSAGHSIDVAIVGHVRLQGGDLAIAKAIRADPRLAGVPLVLAPVSGVRGYARDVREAGYSAYIPRPFQGAELLQCLRAVMVHGHDSATLDDPLITRHNVTDQPNLPTGRVLLADDDSVSRHVTRLQVARLGYLVDEVAGGADAVAAAATGAYQLILLDCQMPGMDGLAAAAAIRRAERNGRRAFIAALTADVSREQRDRCRQAGMDDFLEKPLRLQRLAELLNTHLRRGPDTTVTDARTAARDAAVATGLNLLAADIGPEKTLELVREYVAGVDLAIERLSHLDLVDASVLRSVAHRLLGGARILGLVRFERIWAALSDGPEGAEPSMPPMAIHELRDASAELATWIDSHQRKQHA